ncbi:hypothetical protein BKA70DRAFT_1062422, partial [Coprinopsis sp. MPI-PUGE-AT-0042]
ELAQQINALTKALQEAIELNVPKAKQAPDRKRWWDKSLNQLRKECKKLSRLAYRFRGLTDHESHEQFRAARNRYAVAILTAKRDHWEAYLEDASVREMWTANRYIKE